MDIVACTDSKMSGTVPLPSLYAGIMKILHAKVMDECIAFIRKKG